jgi:hypothetical protein
VRVAAAEQRAGADAVDRSHRDGVGVRCSGSTQGSARRTVGRTAASGGHARGGLVPARHHASPWRSAVCSARRSQAAPTARAATHLQETASCLCLSCRRPRTRASWQCCT